MLGKALYLMYSAMVTTTSVFQMGGMRGAACTRRPVKGFWTSNSEWMSGTPDTYSISDSLVACNRGHR